MKIVADNRYLQIINTLELLDRDVESTDYNICIGLVKNQKIEKYNRPHYITNFPIALWRTNPYGHPSSPCQDKFFSKITIC
jgi:hypothetical protein